MKEQGLEKEEMRIKELEEMAEKNEVQKRGGEKEKGRKKFKKDHEEKCGEESDSDSESGNCLRKDGYMSNACSTEWRIEESEKGRQGSSGLEEQGWGMRRYKMRKKVEVRLR